MLLVAAALGAGIIAWRVVPIILHPRSRAIGDGTDPQTYGFDLTHLRVPRDLVVGSGMPRDGLPTLDDPAVMTAGEVDRFNEQVRGKYLVGEDRVIGVVIDRDVRAYPLRVLNWHEIVNDRLGDEPIAVSYSPLSDSAVVFSRRVDEQELSFGISGLLFNSHTLLYDRRESAAQQSLWSQLLARAVAGPAVHGGKSLEVLPAVVVRWDAWRARHPETTVLAPDRVRLKRYSRSPYSSYRGSDLLRFPVRPLPPDESQPLKRPVLVVEAGGEQAVLSLHEIGRLADSNGVWRTVLGGVPLRFAYRKRPPTAFVDAEDGTPVSVIPTFWFAWYASHPDSTLWRPDTR
ncbi:MAG: DUF3179 domain-containing protein [Acidobacteriota bacterium]|nr:MAG: DUF3179 domain-containing protein [Acidobacteriota bacterium]